MVSHVSHSVGFAHKHEWSVYLDVIFHPFAQALLYRRDSFLAAVRIPAIVGLAYARNKIFYSVIICIGGRKRV